MLVQTSGFLPSRDRRFWREMLRRSLFRKMLEGYPAAAEALRDIMAARLAVWSKDLGALRRKLDK